MNRKTSILITCAILFCITFGMSRSSPAFANETRENGIAWYFQTYGYAPSDSLT